MSGPLFYGKALACLLLALAAWLRLDDLAKADEDGPSKLWAAGALGAIVAILVLMAFAGGVE